MRELSSKFEGVETVDVGTLFVEFDAKIRISPHLQQKNVPTDFITFPQVSRTARAEATSLVRETRAKVGDLKGKVPYSIVRLRVLVKKYKPA